MTVRVLTIRHSHMTSDARTAREASALGMAGYDVHVLALRGDGLPEVEARNGYVVHRLLSESSSSFRQPLKKAMQLRERSEMTLAFARALKPHIVHAHDADTLSAGNAVRRATGARLVWGADELYPEMLVANRSNVSPLVLAYWRRLERRLVPGVDAVITVGDALAQELHVRFGVDSVVVRSVPELQPIGDSSRLRRRLGIGDSAGVLLLYQGLVNVGRGLPQVIKAVESVPTLHFAIQGDGATLRDVLSLAAQSPASDRIHYLGVAPVDELNEWAAGADIGDLLLENVSLNNYLSAPNKLFQYMMAGIPVLASDFPELSRVLCEGPAGRVVDPTDSGAVHKVLAELVASPKLRASMGRNGRRLAETKYNWDVEKGRLLDLYERLSAPLGLEK